MFQQIKVDPKELVFGPNKYNRSDTRERALAEHRKLPFYKKVIASIRQKGIVNPLIVIEKHGKYRVIYGHNRLVAALEISYKTVPVVVVPEGMSPAKFKDIVYEDVL